MQLPSSAAPAAPILDTAFDAVVWLRDRAARTALPPLKLQALLFLAQVWCAARNRQRWLMPATFVADDRGPIEPNLERALESGWDGGGCGVTASAQALLDDVWRRYAGMPVATVVLCATALPGYPQPRRGVARPVIDIAPIACALAEASRRQALTAAPKRLRTQEGRAVLARPWRPQASPR